MTLKDWLEATDYRITEGSDFGWYCYGPNTYTLNYTAPGEDVNDASCVYSRDTQRVLEVTAYDAKRDKAYRWIDPEYKEAHDNESVKRGFEPDVFVDGDSFIELETPEDMLQKATAIVNCMEYDGRVQVPIELSDAEVFALMKTAHERDVTFNALVAEIMQEAIERFKPIDELEPEDDWEFG